MKKILSIALVVTMLLSCVVFTANAADYGYGWQWDDETAYGYCQDTGVTATNVVIEYDASIVKGANGANWALWTESGGYMYVDPAAGTVYVEGQAATVYNWGDLVHDNWHHVAHVFEDGTATFVIDGVEIASYSGVTPNTNSYLFFSYEGVLTIDNWTISDLEGNVLFVDDFEGETSNFSAGLGSKVALLSDPTGEAGGAEGVVSNAAYVNSGYFYKQELPAGAQTWEFDMWLMDDSSAIQFWADTAATRYTIGYNYVGVNVAGGGSAYGEADVYSALTWNEAGTGFLVPGWHHFKVELGVNGTDAIYQDGNLVWQGSTTAAKYWDECIIINTSGSGVALDNVSVNGEEAITFEDGDYGFFGNEEEWTLVEVVVSGEVEAECPHLATEERVDVAPTCQAEGLMGIYCLNDACTVEGGRIGEYAIATVDHAWPDESNCSYENNSKVWYCTYGCGAKATASIADEETYTGDIWYYYDMNDATATQNIQGFFDAEGLVVADGVGYIPEGNDQSYHQAPHNARDNKAWSVTFDVNVTGTHDTSDTTGYGHKVYFWFGGQSGLANEAGYDFDKGCFYIKPNTGSTYDAIENYVDFPMNEWNTIKFEFNAPGEDAFYDEEVNTYCAIYVNGEEVVKFSTSIDPWDDAALYELPTETSHVIIRTFGVTAAIDNYVLGSADFAWVEEEVIPYGDVNGDGIINTRDLLFIKKYVANVITAEDIVFANADFNGDGVVNSADVLSLKKLLVA